MAPAQQQAELLRTSEAIALVLYDRRQRSADVAKRMDRSAPEWLAARRDVAGYLAIADTRYASTLVGPHAPAKLLRTLPLTLHGTLRRAKRV